MARTPRSLGIPCRRVLGWAAEDGGEFIIRASHLERLVEIHNPRLHRWEREHLGDLVDTVPLPLKREVAFTAQRSGYRDRLCATRAGEFALPIPSLRQGTYFPCYLEPRRKAELALLAVVQAAWNADAPASRG
ncbi:MAG: hypothetical protein GX649_17455 [Chloroflexi bacterium]|nr:hypothetical protein [Chloroflexota bacterium]